MSLYPFQEETVKKSIAFLKRWGGCYVANEQGLGKCCTSVDTVRRLGGGSVLIISPAVMTFTWEKEIYKFSPGPSYPTVKVIEGKENLEDELTQSWIIISYTLASKPEWIEKLSKCQFDFLIIDEAHYCLHPESLIATEYGCKPLKDIEVGDKVLTVCNNELIYTPVVQIHIGDKEAQVRLTLEDGRILSLLSWHLVRTNGEWREAADVKVSDRVSVVPQDLGCQGTPLSELRVESVKVFEPGSAGYSDENYIDLTLAEGHNYFANGINVHNCKNHSVDKNGVYKTARVKAVLSDYWKLAKYHIALSGTPMTVNVTDCYNLFSRILPEEESFTSFWKFAGTYAYRKVNPFGTTFYGLKNHEKLSQIIRSNFFIRYRKDEVLKQLPSKIFQTITLPESYAVELRDADKQETAYREYQKRLADLIAGKPLPPEPATLAEHRRLQGERKVPAMVDFIRNQMEQGIPLVVFAYHKSVIAQLADDLAEFKPIVITGSTPNELRAKYVEDFQAGRTNLALLNIVAGGVGITLTAASTVLLAEYSWVASEIAQAIDRVHRIGQENQVVVYTMVAANSLDETMCDVVLRRAKESSKVFDTVVSS